MSAWLNFKLDKYPLVIALYFPDKWESFSVAKPMGDDDVLKAQLILAFEEDGTTRILKNRWGYQEGFSG